MGSNLRHMHWTIMYFMSGRLSSIMVLEASIFVSAEMFNSTPLCLRSLSPD